MIKILVKARFAAMLAAMTPKKKNQNAAQKPSKGMLALMIVLYLYLGGVFMMLFFSAFFGISQLYARDGMEWMYFSMFVIMSFAMMFIGSVFTAKSQLFEAKDNELLLTMPIRPRDILASRMLVLLLLNYVMELVVALPAAAVWAVYGTHTFLPWVGFLLTFLALPFFGLAVSCLFAWLISLLTARLPKKSFVTVIAFVLFFFGYLYLVNNMDQYLLAFAEKGGEIASAFSAILPLYWMGSGIANGNLLHLGASLLIYLLPFVLTWYLLSRSFIKLLTTKRGTRKKKAAANLTVRGGTVSAALLGREFRRLGSSSTYMLNCGLAVPLAVIVTVLACIKRTDFVSMLTSLGLGDGRDLIAAIFAAAICFIGATAPFTAPSVSLEGKTLWLLRTMPVSSADILRAKLKMHICLMAPVSFACGFAVALVYQPSLPVVLLLLVTPALYSVWVANIGLICNLFHPVFDWINEAQVVKQGTAILLTMLFSTLSLFVLLGGGVVLGIFSMWLTLVFVCAALAVGNILTYRYLMRGGVKRWDALSA